MAYYGDNGGSVQSPAMMISPEDLALRRKMALALMQQGTSAEPVRHWTQGLARMAQAALGGYDLYKTNQEEGGARLAAINDFTRALNDANAGSPQNIVPQGAAASPQGQTNPIAAALSKGADEVTPEGTPQDYINRAFGTTPQQRDIATRTVLGEAANQGQTGMNAVADVMRNRAVNGGFGGTNMADVALAKGQFEPWMTQAGRARMAAYSPTSQPYQAAQSAVDSAGIGGRPDVTGGAQYFYAPQAQQKLASLDGRPVVPSFATGQPSAVIGDHNFYTGQAPAQPPQQVAQAPQPAPQAAPPAQPSVNPKLIGALSSPFLPPAMAGIAAGQINQQLQPAELKTFKNLMGEDVPYTWNKNTQVLKPLSGSGTSVPGSGVGPDATPDEMMAAYEKQYPGVTARVEQLYRGEGAMPNARQNKIDAPAMQLIQKVHPDWNMTMWTGKNNLVKGLSSEQPSSAGGRLLAARNSFEHLANASDTAVEKGNWDTGLYPLTAAANYAGSMTSHQRDVAAKMEREATTYGGERTKFLTGSEGTQDERLAFLRSLGPNTAAPSQMAGTIEGEYIQMKGALLHQEQHVRETMGEQYLKDHPIITEKTKEDMKRIEKNIERLRNGGGSQPNSAVAPSSAAGAPPQGVDPKTWQYMTPEERALWKK